MVIKDTALCGLGQTSPNPVLSTMDNFYDEYLAHVREHRCPSHQCRELTQYSSIRRNVKDVRSVPVFVRCMQLQVDGKFLILSIRKLVSVAVPVWRSVSSERFMSTKFIYNHGNN